jgi:hypothetical protein
MLTDAEYEDLTMSIVGHRTFARALSYAVLRDTYSTVAEVSSSAASEVPSTVEFATAGMHTVYIRDPWSARCVPVDVPASITVGGLASALGVAILDPMVLVYGGMRDLTPICTMGELDQFSEVSTLGVGICLAFPEMPAIVFDRLFGGVWDVGLHRNQDPDEFFMLYLEAKFRDLEASRVQPPPDSRHRRVQFVVHHVWNDDKRDVFSMSSGVEVARLRSHVLRAIPVEAHRRCQVLAHSRVIAHRSNLRIRDITTDDRNPVVFLRVMVGARGGTTKRKLSIDDSQGSSSFGRRQEEEETALEPGETALEPGETVLEPEEAALEPKETALEPKETALEPEVDAGPSAAAAAHESVPMHVGTAASSNVAAGKGLSVAGTSTTAPEVSNCVSESVTADPPHPLPPRDPGPGEPGG